MGWHTLGPLQTWDILYRWRVLASHPEMLSSTEKNQFMSSEFIHLNNKELQIHNNVWVSDRDAVINRKIHSNWGSIWLKFTILHRHIEDLVILQYWSCSSELCMKFVYAYCVMIFKCSAVFEVDESRGFFPHIFVSPMACSLLRSKG